MERLNQKLIDAVRRGDSLKVEKLFTPHPDPNVIIDEETPLSIASANGDLSIAMMLIENGANVNGFDDGDLIISPLINATINNHVNIVKLLLKNGADPNQEDFDLMTPIEYAAQNQNASIIKVLLNTGKINKNSKIGAFDEAVRLGNISLIKLFLNSGVNINDLNELFHSNALFFVRDINTLNFLLQNGININQKIFNDEGHSAFVNAIIDNTPTEVIKYLYNLGIGDVNEGNEERFSALIWAVRNNNPELVEFLLENGADKNIRYFEDDKTALDYAIERGNPQIIAMLQSPSRIGREEPEAVYTDRYGRSMSIGGKTGRRGGHLLNTSYSKK